MPATTLFSIVETPGFPSYSRLYQRLGMLEHHFVSIRKAIGQLKTVQPDIVVAEFLYGYGNNYAGVNISNLDVFLYSLQKYAPRARIIVLVDKSEREYAERLAELFELHAILVLPVSEQELQQALTV